MNWGQLGSSHIVSREREENMMKKIVLAVMSLLFVMGFGITAYASEPEDAAVDEIISIEELVKSVDSEDVEELIAFMKEKLAAGELTSDRDIAEAIEEGEEKFSVSLTEEEKEKILQVVHKIKELGLDPEQLLEQAQGLYEQFGDELIDNAEETIKKLFKESVSKFVSDFGSTVKNFFSNIFS